MNLDEYQNDVINRILFSQIENYHHQLCELFLELGNIDELSFYKYDYEYDEYIYEYTLDHNAKKIEYSTTSNKKYYIYLKYKDINFGKLELNKRLKGSRALKKVLKELLKNLHKFYKLDKETNGDEISFNIHIVYDEQLREFANNLGNGLKGLFNVDVNVSSSLEKVMPNIKSKDIKHVVIYIVNSLFVVYNDEDNLKKINDLVIVIGPNEHQFSMYCGKLGVQNYISINEFKVEDLKEIVVNTRKKLFNKNNFNNKIIALSGIAGGIGTSTVAMNTANALASNLYDKNILYIDLSTTKAISNLFLEKNPLPEKTILDLLNSSDYSIQNSLNNGLVKVKENFYAVTGIQKHIDKEYLEQNFYIEKLVDYIVQSSENFNFIIIDLGICDASNLKTTIYDLASELWIITEMNLPHISKLKTFFNLMKRAGFREKIFFLVNRFNSENSISVNDVTSILNMNKEDKFHFNYRIPNDYKTLGKCWNYCELVTNTTQDSVFVKSLDEILTQKGFYQKQIKTKNTKSLFSFFKNKEEK